ncbi:SusC/RagA family TonB-linked outer membrane protein [Seonamhaeicola marinus]|uniref:TonB-dependent receptor n=1 Tax=Seonamhaeicola marinus TaxID=1912246 RepID=A0A5D0HVW5_9FLAO|nr:TonB-dependent receptor [Seonamhaeicola marinus]TYA74669.1 TonB-dependent receptor [Seonamhaeicola marinus]
MKKTKLNALVTRHLLFYFIAFFISMTAIGQNTINGTVSDKSGPLPGANVIVKSTSNGTQTDFDGNYSLNNVTNSDILVVSFLGYKTKEVTVGSQTTVNIILEEDTESLDEVVVVGYGTQRKADLTGSVSTIKGGSFTKAATPNLNASLAGKVTGVTAMSRSGSPGSEDIDFFIRGKSTFNDGNNSPLILVDGVQRGMSRINPNDIASVTVLKDAASAAIYGVQGANGVILITTKRATEGKAEISYTGSFGVQDPLFLPRRMNSYEYATHLNEAIFNLAERSGGTYVPEFTDEQLAAFRDGTGANTDWWAEAMDESAPIQSHNITISNGNKNIRYLTSLEYLDQDGLYDASSYKRYNFRANIDGDITKNLSLSLNLAGRIDERNESAQENFGLINQSFPTFEPYIDINGQRELGWNGLNQSPIGAMNNSGYNRNTNSSFQSTVSLSYKVPFIEGLTAKYAYSFDRDVLKRKQFETPYVFYTGSDPIADRKESIPTIELLQRMTERTRKTGQFTLNYQKSLGDHSFGGLFVFEHSDFFNEWIQVFRDGFLSESIDQIFAGSTARIGNDGSANENARLGYALRVNYNYKDKYLLQLNTRYDKSFNFPKDNAGGWFPALSAAWRISNEDFMQGTDWLSNLKLRFGWGVYGNDRITPYQYLSLFEFSETRNNPAGTVTANGFQQAISPDVIPNPLVTWEKAKIYNFGLDYGLFNNKITGDLEIFKKRTEDLLIARRDIPDELGASLAPSNVGIVENRGLEASLRYKTNIGNVNMNLQGTFTYATSEIIEMSEAANVPDGLRQTGRPFDSRYGYISLGLFKDADDVANSPDQSFFGDYQSGDIKYKDISGPDGVPDGKIDGDDRTFIGRGGIPEIVFGLNTYFSYKGFELSADFQGASRFTHRYKPAPFVNNSNGPAAFTDAWTVDNPNGWLPRLYQGTSSNNDPNSDYWLTDGWFIKLRNAEFAYNIPSQLPVLQKLGVDSLRLAVSGNNLLSISNIDFWDPEAADIGTHPWYYMQMRTVSFSVNVTF